MIEPQYLYNKINSDTTPFTFVVQPAPSNETSSHLGDVAATQLATVDVSETNLLYARDMYTNLQIH